MPTPTFVIQQGTSGSSTLDAADPIGTASPRSPERWNTFTDGEVSTAREFVEAAAVLLLSVARGRSAEEAAQLVAGARAVLATSGRESSLPLDPARLSGATAEVARQTEAIGQQISDWAEESLATATERHPTGDFPHHVDLRSHCEGHVWTPPVVRLLTGPAGGPTDMQVYNEWLHQLVLLRDALLPFADWREVPVRVGPAGLRAVEVARTGFLTELLTRRVSHRALVALATQVVTGGSGVPGYGVLTDRGAAVPAVLGHDVVASPRWLLRWDPALRLAAGAAPRSVVYAEEDYLAAPRVGTDQVAATAEDEAGGGLPAATTQLVATASPDGATATVALEVTAGDRTTSVDLGQAVRGHRYAYRAAGAAAPSPDDEAVRQERPEGVTDLDPWAVLGAPGLVWSPAGTFRVAAGEDPHVDLALLGRLYPENVVLRHGEGWPAVLAAGKAGPARIVLDLMHASPRRQAAPDSPS